MPYGSKHQIIVPKENRVSELILTELHNHRHMAAEFELSELRKKYWIVKGRSVIKRVTSRCIQCKHRNVKNLQPMMINLPPLNTEGMKPPFNSTGIDLFGPVLIN